MRPVGSAGSWRVDDAGTVPVQQTTIDALKLGRCDAIYLDIEGAEPGALRGAERTIRTFRPVLHLEILPRARGEILSITEALGYGLVRHVHKDAIFVHGIDTPPGDWRKARMRP